MLLRLSAYDYAMAGTLSGDHTYMVDRTRYASVVTSVSAGIQRFSAATLTATVDREGSLRDRVVALADGLVDLSHDATTYADGGDATVFSKVTSDVARSWEDLRALVHGVHDPSAAADIDKTIARGSSFVVSARAEKAYAVTLGPFATADEAQATAARVGTVESVARSAPFIVRIGTYDTVPAADAAITAIAKKGFTALRTDEERVQLTRSGPAPDVELWSEPWRVFDTWGNARRVAVSPRALWVATGSDDGTVAIFNGNGVLRSLPRFNAGVSHLVFSDDAKWLMGGGQTLANFILPQGTAVGSMVHLSSPAQQVVYVPTAYYFAVIAPGPTGDAPGGAGVLSGRSPDGQPLFIFPIEEPAAGGAIAATSAGELYVATTRNKVTDVRRLSIVNREWRDDGILTIPGQIQQLVIDRSGILGAAMTDQGVFRFGPHDTDPARTLTRIGDPVREISFGPDERLYLLAKEQVSARDLHGELLWSAPLVDGRRLVTAARPVVLDGPDQLLVFSDKGIPDTLGSTGNVQDVSASSDGQLVAVLDQARRALLFKLP